jgi:predicted transcriptional regulator
MSEPNGTTEEQMLLAKQAEVLALISAHFTITDVPIYGPGNSEPEHTERALICNLCGKRVTWVTRHLSERHDMDVEVWRLPKFADNNETW